MKKSVIIGTVFVSLLLLLVLYLSIPTPKIITTIPPSLTCDYTDQCGTGTCNKQLNLCVQESEECTLLLGTNNTNAIDILFINEGMKRTDAIKTVNTMLGTNKIQGLFNTKPFSEYKGSFNIWFTEKQKSTTETPDRKETKIVAGRCPQADKTITISKEKFRSYCYFSGDCYLSTGKYSEEYWGKLLLHEFGHGFGGLADEYVEEELGSKPRSPNCAPDEKTAKEWWGENNTLYPGCSYVDGNYRSTQNSLMKSHITQKEYGKVNEERITTIIHSYDNTTSGTGEYGLVQEYLLSKEKEKITMTNLGIRKGKMPQNREGNIIIQLKDGNFTLHETRAELTTEHLYEEETVPDAGTYYTFDKAYEIIILPYSTRATMVTVINEKGVTLVTLNLTETNQCNNICEAGELCAKDCAINICTPKTLESIDIQTLLTTNSWIYHDDNSTIVLEEKNGMYTETRT